MAAQEPWEHHGSLLSKGRSWLAPGPTDALGVGRQDGVGVVSQANGATFIVVDLRLTE